MAIVAPAMSLGHNLGPILQFGHFAQKLSWPDFSQLRLIQVGRNIQRMDVFAIILWVHGYWILLTLNMKGTTMLMRRSFGLQSDTPIIGTVAATVFMGGFLVAVNQNVMFRETQWGKSICLSGAGRGFSVAALRPVGGVSPAQPHSATLPSSRKPD